MNKRRGEEAALAKISRNHNIHSKMSENVTLKCICRIQIKWKV